MCGSKGVLTSLIMSQTCKSYTFANQFSLGISHLLSVWQQFLTTQLLVLVALIVGSDQQILVGLNCHHFSNNVARLQSFNNTSCWPPLFMHNTSCQLSTGWNVTMYMYKVYIKWHQCKTSNHNVLMLTSGWLSIYIKLDVYYSTIEISICKCFYL